MSYLNDLLSHIDQPVYYYYFFSTTAQTFVAFIGFVGMLCLFYLQMRIDSINKYKDIIKAIAERHNNQAFRDNLEGYELNRDQIIITNVSEIVGSFPRAMEAYCTATGTDHDFAIPGYMPQIDKLKKELEDFDITKKQLITCVITALSTICSSLIGLILTVNCTLSIILMSVTIILIIASLINTYSLVVKLIPLKPD
jgi:hypothetical protein